MSRPGHRGFRGDSALLATRSSPDALIEIARYVEPHLLLSPAERGRHDGLRLQVDRDDFVAARALARLLVLTRRGECVTAERLRAVRFAQRCTTCAGPHGRPVIVDEDELRVSWAHAKGVVAAAVAGDPVGVDVERVRADPPPGLPGDGSAPWLTWARVEALTKLGMTDLGTGLSWSAWLDGPPCADGRHTELPTGSVAWVADGSEEHLGVVWAVALEAPEKTCGHAAVSGSATSRTAFR